MTARSKSRRRRPAPARRRRRPAHPRPAVALSRRRRLSRHHGAETPPKRARSSSGLGFDLLVLDVMMPGETGFDLAKSHARDFRRADPDADRARRSRRPHRGLEIGADDYLPKPFEPRELLLRIGNILQAAPRRRRVPRGRKRRASAISCFISSAANCARAARRCASPTASARCCAFSRQRRARRCRDRSSPARRRRRTSARSTCRSTACAARSSAIRPIPLYLQTVRGIGYRLLVTP